MASAMRLSDAQTLVGEFGCAQIGRRYGRLLVTGEAQGSVQVWKLGSDQPLRELVGLAGEVENVSFDAEEAHVGATSRGTFKFWDLQHGKVVRTLDVKTCEGDVSRAISFHPRADIFACAGRDALCFYDLRQRQRIHELAEPTSAFQFSPCGKWALVGGAEGTVKLWDVGTRKAIKVFKRSDSDVGPVTSVAFHPTKIFGAAGTANGGVSYYSLETFRRVVSIPSSTDIPTGARAVASLAFAPGSLRLFAAHRDCIRLIAGEAAEFSTERTYCGESEGQKQSTIACVHAIGDNHAIGVTLAGGMARIWKTTMQAAAREGTGNAENTPPSTTPHATGKTVLGDKTGNPAPAPAGGTRGGSSLSHQHRQGEATKQQRAEVTVARSATAAPPAKSSSAQVPKEEVKAAPSQRDTARVAKARAKHTPDIKERTEAQKTGSAHRETMKVAKTRARNTPDVKVVRRKNSAAATDSPVPVSVRPSHGRPSSKASPSRAEPDDQDIAEGLTSGHDEFCELLAPQLGTIGIIRRLWNKGGSSRVEALQHAQNSRNAIVNANLLKIIVINADDLLASISLELVVPILQCVRVAISDTDIHANIVALDTLREIVLHCGPVVKANIRTTRGSRSEDREERLFRAECGKIHSMVLALKKQFIADGYLRDKKRNKAAREALEAFKAMQ